MCVGCGSRPSCRRMALQAAGLAALRFPPCQRVAIAVAYLLTDQSVNALRGTPMTTLRTRAGRISYGESGSGPTVLLLHANLHDRHDFDPIVPTLDKHYR